MRFHLSTLLIVTTALAVVFAQCAYVLNHADATRMSVSNAELPWVIGLIPLEVFLLVAWMLARRGVFPWRGMVVTAAIVDLAIASYALLAGAPELRERVALSILLLLVVGQVLALAIAALFAAYSIIFAIGRSLGPSQHRGISPAEKSNALS